MKQRNYEEIIDYAKSIIDTCKTRVELVKKTAEHFGLARGTIEFYFVRYGLKTNFRRGSIFLIEASPSIKMLKLVMEKPRFCEDLKNNGIEDPSVFYRTLQRNGFPIKRFRYSHTNSGNGKKFSKIGLKLKEKRIIYYFSNHNNIVWKMLLDTFGSDCGSNSRSILLALGLKRG